MCGVASALQNAPTKWNADFGDLFPPVSDLLVLMVMAVFSWGNDPSYPVKSNGNDQCLILTLPVEDSSWNWYWKSTRVSTALARRHCAQKLLQILLSAAIFLIHSVPRVKLTANFLFFFFGNLISSQTVESISKCDPSNASCHTIFNSSWMIDSMISLKKWSPLLLIVLLMTDRIDWRVLIGQVLKSMGGGGNAVTID